MRRRGDVVSDVNRYNLCSYIWSLGAFLGFVMGRDITCVVLCFVAATLCCGVKSILEAIEKQ